MDLKEIAKYRLLSQQIGTTEIETAHALVSYFGAVQAQEYAHTKWSLGVRLPHLKDNDIENDFANGKILRTHLLRPTWHFVASQDIRRMLSLTSPRVNAANNYMYRKLELNNDVFNRCKKILINTLQGGKQFTRDKINKEFKKKKIIAEGHRLSYIMMHAELAGIICSGARQGNQFTYALLDERVPAANELDKEEALSKLAKQYFISRGPATLKDFSTWSGQTLTDCKKGLEIVKPHLAKAVVKNDDYYFAADLSLNKKMTNDVFLLPIYDEFIMGYKNRSAILMFKNSLKPDTGFRYDSMIVSEGQIIGTWKRTINNKSIELEFEFFKPTGKKHSKAFEIAVNRLGDFTNRPVLLDYD